MRISKLLPTAGFPLVPGACSVAIPGAYAEPRAGFANSASQINPAMARLTAAKSKEDLTRLKGLRGTEVDYCVPDALARRPRSVGRVAKVEANALRNRVDPRIATLALEAQALACGLTDQTGIVRDLGMVSGVEIEREPDRGKMTTPQVEVEFAIPIFESDKATMREADLSYLQAAIVLAKSAVNVRSEARGAETAFPASYKVARHYQDVLVPLTTTVEGEGLISYNGMIANTFVMGTSGIGDMAKMSMPLSDNTIAMTSGWSPYGPIEMGGMLSVVKVRYGIDADDYSDPGWYQNPSGALPEFASNNSPKTTLIPKPTQKG